VSVAAESDVSGAAASGASGTSMHRAAGEWGVSGLTINYGRRPALVDVTLAVPGGAITAVVGSDGSGKTTLARALAGALKPSAGSVRRPASRRIGYVSAASGVYRDLTVDENLEFTGGAYGLRGAALRERAAQLLTRTRLTDAHDRLAGNLSGGMRQKLAFAMAVLHEPELLILDEPTTGVDPVSRAELWRLIAGAAAAGTGVLFATSYLDEAERASMVLVLNRGRELVGGDPAAIVAALPGAMFTVPVAGRRDGSGSEGDAAAEPGAAEAVLDGREAPYRWRRGADWRVWSPGGAPPAGGTAARVDLSDAVIVASLQAREGAA
jgi:ABC-2 type transport system ATP-binding protein